MLDKYTWYVIDTKQDGKRYAYAWRVHNCYNLLAELKQHPDAETINACATKKEAEAIAQYWNECHKRNGDYMFSNGTF